MYCQRDLNRLITQILMENLQHLNKIKNILNAFEDSKITVYEFHTNLKWGQSWLGTSRDAFQILVVQGHGPSG